jgi:hypothetical protein
MNQSVTSEDFPWYCNDSYRDIGAIAAQFISSFRGVMAQSDAAESLFQRVAFHGHTCSCSKKRPCFAGIK